MVRRDEQTREYLAVKEAAVLPRVGAAAKPLLIE
jgi:hypothetical protein